MLFSKRLSNISQYAFSSIAIKIKKVEKATGRKVLNLGVGSPDFPPSKKYLEKLKQFLSLPDSHLYPGYGALPEFSQGLKTWYQRRFNVVLSENELYPLLGSKEGIGNLALTLLDPGDELLIPDPGYPGFSGPAKMFGAKIVTYDLKEENNFKIIFADLEKKISKKTKCIWANFPSNPTGQTILLSDLEKLVNLAIKKKVWLIYDNAYSEIYFSKVRPPSILQIKNAKEVSVEIGSFSKTFSFAGYRMGWIVGNSDLIAALSKVKSQLDSGLNIALQKLGGYALENFDNDWYREMLDDYQRRKVIIAEKLVKLGLKIFDFKAGLYLWAKIPEFYKNSEEFSEKILNEKQVFLTPGTVFGKNGDRFVRVSFCSDIKNIDSYL